MSNSMDPVIGDGNTAPRSLPSVLIFCLIVSIPVFSVIVFGAVDAATWTIISILGSAILALWAIEVWRGGIFPLTGGLVLAPVAAILLIAVIQLIPLFPSSLPNGLLPYEISVPLSLDPYATRFFLLHAFVYLIFLAAAIGSLDRDSRFKKVVIGTIIFGTLMAFFGILQRLGNVDGIYGLRPTPQAIPFGPFVNQHHFAGFMEMTAGLAFGLLFGSRLAKERRLMLAVAAIIMGVAVVMTSSRGGLLSFLGVLAFVLVGNSLLGIKGKANDGFLSSSPKRTAAIGAVALVLVVFGVVLFLGVDSSLMRGLGLDPGDDISNGRLHFWQIALRIFADHPILGAGFESFGVAFTKYDSWPGVFRVEQAHNDYLQILADAGLVGLACVAAFIFLLFRKAFLGIKGDRDDFRRSAKLGAIAGIFGILIHSFFDFPLRTPSNMFFFLLLAAIAVARMGNASERLR